MRVPQVHESKSIRFTEHAAKWCYLINLYRKLYPTHSFDRMSEHFNLSASTIRRYYYGVHDANEGYFGRGYTQVRRGASVPIELSAVK
jgi:hypothetical protein